MQRLTVHRIRTLLARHPEVRLRVNGWLMDGVYGTTGSVPPECCPMALVLHDIGKLKLTRTRWDVDDWAAAPMNARAVFEDYGAGFQMGFDGQAAQVLPADKPPWFSGFWDGCAARAAFFPHLSASVLRGLTRVP